MAEALGYGKPDDFALLAKQLDEIEHKTEGGKSVLAALKERRSNRNIGDKELPPQVLSNLLWAGFGINRESGPFGGPGRTAASATLPLACASASSTASRRARRTNSSPSCSRSQR